MALIKEVFSLILLMVISIFFASGARINNPHELERLNERRSGISYEQKSIAAHTITSAEPNYAPGYNNNPYDRVIYPEDRDLLPPSPPTARPVLPTETTTKLLGTRNNFGDLPQKCGPNQERINGECQDV